MGNKIKLKLNDGELLNAFLSQADVALEEIGLRAEGYAAVLTPVDTGTLRGSITHKVSGKKVYIGTNVEYGIYQELGTSRGIKPKHMIKKAASEHTEEYKAVLKKYLKK